VKSLLRSVMLTYDDIGHVKVVSQGLSEEEPELLGDPVAAHAIDGVTDPNPSSGRMTEAELATVGNV